MSMLKMTMREIADTANTLSNQISAGIPVAEATEILAEIQPARREFWTGTTRRLQRGHPLSLSLSDVWPESLVNIVQAGELAGKTGEVFRRIERTMLMQILLKDSMKKILYPIFILLSGLSVFLFIMVGIVPKTIKASAAPKTGNDVNFFTSLSIWLEYVFKNHWLVLVLSVSAGGFIFLKWAMSESGKEVILRFLIEVPYLGVALKNLYFGVWAEYLAMIFAAGIPLIQGLRSTSSTLPARLRNGVFAFEHDITIKSFSVQRAVDIKQLVEDDPRHEWPIYLRRAFLVGAKTGEMDKELVTAGPLLVSEGVKRLDIVISVANKVALFLSGMVVAISFAGLYLPMITALKHVR